jgi:hypothetical protein
LNISSMTNLYVDLKPPYVIKIVPTIVNKLAIDLKMISTIVYVSN